jgi:hypothetical protein
MRPGPGVTSVKQFVDLARTRPLNVASTGSGTASQFTGMLFQPNQSLQ